MENKKEIEYLDKSYCDKRRINIKNMEEYLGLTIWTLEPGLVFVPYIMTETVSKIEFTGQKEAEKRVISINRERQIDSIIENKEFIPFTIEETDEYKQFNERWHKPVSSIYYKLADGK